MNKQISALYIQWNIMQPQKEQTTDTCYNVDESQNFMLSGRSQIRNYII